MPERRVRAYKKCAVPDCDWKLVTEWFDGSPDNILHVSETEQMWAAGEHMKLHYKPERTHLS